MNAELTDFVRRALTAGENRENIAATLAKAGWDPTVIKSAIGAYADIPFAVPVPRPRPYLSAREVFLYLVMFTSLYWTVGDVADLAFSYINHAFPDTAMGNPYDSFFDDIRWSFSSLVVTCPIFLLVFRHVNKTIAANPVRRESRPRKWLTYLTLYIAAFSLIGDVVSVIYNALGGELSIRFVLKVVVVGVLAGGSFFYFLSDMKKEEQS